jgi:hypothetical protein
MGKDMSIFLDRCSSMDRATPTPRAPSLVIKPTTVQDIIEYMGNLDADMAANILYTLASDHPGMTPEVLEDLSNKLGRQAHEMARRQS